MKKLFTNFKGDAFGGITAGIVALPLALAFGVSSGLGPTAGLYGAIFISFFAALLGGTNTLISGPTAPMTAVSMVIIAGLVAANDGDVNKALPIILAIFIMAGLMQIGLGALGLGKYMKYIPYPVVSGFMTAIGVVILVTQILPAIGYYPKEDAVYVEQFKPQAKEIILNNLLKEDVGEDVLVLKDFEETIKKAAFISEKEIEREAQSLAGKEASGVLGTFKILGTSLPKIIGLELALALATILIIFGFKRITTAIPSTLVALVVVSGIAMGFELDYRPIEKIPSSLPLPQWEIFTELSLANLTPYFFTALTLSLLGAIDSLLTSVVADSMTKTKHNPNKELVGQGIGNVLAAIFGGIPGAGSTTGTVVNIKSGSKTKLSGMISGLFLFLILLLLGPVASKIPASVLAGVLITVGIGVMDYKGLKAIPSLPKDTKILGVKVSSEVIVMLIVLLLSTFWNLVFAVGIGLIIASLMFMKKIGDLSAKQSDVKPLSHEEYWDDELNMPKHLKQEVFIKHLKGPLFFGSITDFQNLARQIPDTATAVVIRMDRMQYLDQSGLYALEDVLIALKQQGKFVLLVDVMEQPNYLMERIDIIPDLISEENIFVTFKDCLAWLKINIKDKKNSKD